MPDMLFSPEAIALTIVTFLVGGFVKGALGMGLPVVVLALLVLVMPLRDAMAVFLLPSIVANIWQALNGPWLRELLGRMWSYLLAAIISIGVGVWIMAGSKSQIMLAVLGAALCLYSTYSLIAPRLPAPGRHERWMSPSFATIGGVMFGMAGSFMVPAILYLETLRMPRDQFVQALGLTFVTITMALAVFMTGHALVTTSHAVLSAIGIVPVFAGIWLGRSIRRFISEERYRKFFFIALIVAGAYMIVRAAQAGAFG
ncbi:MAG: sulfite exporter TauE/SafE family protein [Pseudomonadota bacterium]